VALLGAYRFGVFGGPLRGALERRRRRFRVGLRVPQRSAYEAGPERARGVFHGHVGVVGEGERGVLGELDDGVEVEAGRKNQQQARNLREWTRNGEKKQPEIERKI
jgi:hypothetical protein